MPLNEYYHGSGEKVMASMKEKYGEKKGESVFYATAQKTGMKPGGKSSNADKIDPRRKK